MNTLPDDLTSVIERSPPPKAAPRSIVTSIRVWEPPVADVLCNGKSTIRVMADANGTIVLWDMLTMQPLKKLDVTFADALGVAVQIVAEQYKPPGG